MLGWSNNVVLVRSLPGSWGICSFYVKSRWFIRKWKVRVSFNRLPGGWSRASQGQDIPHICHFFYTGRIFEYQILHPKKRLKAPKTLKMSLKKSNICIFSLNLEKFTPDKFFFTQTPSVVSVTNMRYEHKSINLIRILVSFEQFLLLLFFLLFTVNWDKLRFINKRAKQHYDKEEMCNVVSSWD